MASSRPQTTRIAVAVCIVLAVIGYLTITSVQTNKSYYVTIAELHGMGTKAYARHLRVAGNVLPGSIQKHGVGANFVLVENANHLPVEYTGSEPPPDTFKDNSQALAIGTFGKDGVFHANEIQAKCASKYAPAKPGATPAAAPVTNTAMLKTAGR